MMNALMLNNVERHIARFYVMAVRAASRAPTPSRADRDDRLLRQMLRTSEAFVSAVAWLDARQPHPDEILDFGVILTRSLEYWNAARAGWSANPAQAALAAAATELAAAADALQDAIASAPWFGNGASRDLAMAMPPRKLQ